MNYSAVAPMSSPHLSIDPAKMAAGRIMTAIRRRLWLIILLAAVGGCVAYGVSLTLPRFYTADGTVVLAAQHFAIPELEGALRGNGETEPLLLVRTEMQAVSAPSLVAAVADDLHLDTMKAFNPALRPPGLLNEVTGWIKSRFVHPSSPPPYALRQAILSEVMRRLTVFNDDRTLVVTVGFTSPDPVLSAKFVNDLLDRYRAAHAAERGQANQQANSVLVGRTAQLTAEIADLEKQAAALRDKSQYIGLRAGSVGQQEVEDLATAAAKASLDRSEIQANWERATALAKAGSSEQIASVLSSDTMSRLRDQEAQAARQYADLSSRYGPNYPGVSQARANLDASRGELSKEASRIVASLSAQLQVARQHEADAQQQLAAARAKAVTATDVKTQLDNIDQEITSRRQLIQTLQASIQQTMGQPSAQTPDVRILSAAQPPIDPSSPQPKLAAVFGAAAGGVLGFVLALATTRSAITGGSPQEASRGLPVFAVLPGSGPARGRLFLPSGAALQPTREAAEALRMLRLRLRTSGESGAPRIVTLIPAESTRYGAQIALSFARLAAADGLRVLLVDGSLQSPVLADMLGAHGPDLSHVLEGYAHWRDALTRDSQSLLDMLLVNKGAANAHALLSGVRLQSILSEAREDYNLIVLSAPSSDTPASAMILSNCADATILVMDSATGKPNDVDRFVENLVVTSHGPVAALLTDAA